MVWISCKWDSIKAVSVASLPHFFSTLNPWRRRGRVKPLLLKLPPSPQNCQIMRNATWTKKRKVIQVLPFHYFCCWFFTLDAKIDPLLETQFAAGRLYATISSRPGQSGRADGYILEGKELEVCSLPLFSSTWLTLSPVLSEEDQDWQTKACACIGASDAGSPFGDTSPVWDSQYMICSSRISMLVWIPPVHPTSNICLPSSK